MVVTPLKCRPDRPCVHRKVELDAATWADVSIEQNLERAKSVPCPSKTSVTQT